MKTKSIPVFSDWLFEKFFLFEKSDGQTFEEFSQARHDGAKAIADAAKEKGGNALLTYEHFRVKLPYYKKAAAGKFNQAVAKSQLSKLMSKLDSGTQGGVSLNQTAFQRLVGEIEVVGELLIMFEDIGESKPKSNMQ
jgi:hypothetical protein